ncbi:MAG: DUF4923 family protein [Methanoregulaceae archaeon]|nr:DUF4923 family protein [Methanoregulaceae archaeon]
MFIAVLTSTILVSGCSAPAKDPVIGTWTWSDEKGYLESYTFNPDHTFSAQALGSEFNGTWEMVSSGHYQVTYHNLNDPLQNETLNEKVLYDSKTDEIYFPGHQRVV